MEQIEFKDDITASITRLSEIEAILAKRDEQAKTMLDELTLVIERAGIGGNEYQSLAMITSASHASPDERLLNGVMGLCGESGEVADLVKKHRFHGTTLDEDKLRKELGDVLWYVAQICDSRGWKMGDVMAGNIEKLKARWPEGFKTGDAAHEESRARDGENEIALPLKPGDRVRIKNHVVPTIYVVERITAAGNCYLRTVEGVGGPGALFPYDLELVP